MKDILIKNFGTMFIVTFITEKAIQAAKNRIAFTGFLYIDSDDKLKIRLDTQFYEVFINWADRQMLKIVLEVDNVQSPYIKTKLLSDKARLIFIALINKYWEFNREENEARRNVLDDSILQLKIQLIDETGEKDYEDLLNSGQQIFARM